MGGCAGGLSQFSTHPIGTGQVPARPPAQPLRERGIPIPFIKRVRHVRDTDVVRKKLFHQRGVYAADF